MAASVNNGTVLESTSGGGAQPQGGSLVSEKAPWIDFCERHATGAAQDFAKSCMQYINMSMPENMRSAVSHKELLKKFLECFAEEFEKDFMKRKLQVGKFSNGIASTGEENSDKEEGGSPKMQHKPFFRRLSFKMLRKSKDFFHKHSEDEAHHNKTKLAKIIVECRKEGIVNYSTPECLDQPSGPPKWEKCRLQLVKATGGYMLEFYSPPKNPKPRCGVFCALITEARETTALEMPDHENTFVLKASNNMEFVIEALDTDDMRSWLATIRYCMRLGPGGSDVNPNDYQSSNAPDLPPRVTGGAVRPNDRLSSTSNFDACPNGDATHAEADIGETLKKELWFHGTLGRSEAAQQVLHDGASGHGRFLIRQSETRTGEFVLTFNFQGRAKHLRMAINEQGHCRVQHYWFQTIYELLEHFRSQPIPLESGGNSDVKLTDYVVNPNARAAQQASLGRPATTSPSTNAPTNVLSTEPQSGAPSVPTNTGSAAPLAAGGTQSAENGGRRLMPLPEMRQVILNGSVRTQEISTEELEAEMTTHRAVDNLYTFS